MFLRDLHFFILFSRCYRSYIKIFFIALPVFLSRKHYKYFKLLTFLMILFEDWNCVPLKLTANLVWYDYEVCVETRWRDLLETVCPRILGKLTKKANAWLSRRILAICIQNSSLCVSSKQHLPLVFSIIIWEI